MRNLITISTVLLGTFLLSPITSASLVTDSFSGSEAFVTPGNLGDHSGNSYTYNFLTSNACATLSYDVTVTVGGGPVHFDARGFGDSSGSNDALQGATETMTIEISNVEVTALAGFTYVSDNVEVGLFSFDLVNNGPNSPQLNWSDDLGGGGLYFSSGTSSGHTETINVTPGAMQLRLSANRHWMWINNAVSQYRGQVSVFHTLPEPSSGLMFLIATGFGMSGRRRIRKS